MISSYSNFDKDLDYQIERHEKEFDDECDHNWIISEILKDPEDENREYKIYQCSICKKMDL